jgi:hypothetical protein
MHDIWLDATCWHFQAHSCAPLIFTTTSHLFFMPSSQEAIVELSSDSDGKSDSSPIALRQQISRIRKVRHLKTGRILPHSLYETL